MFRYCVNLLVLACLVQPLVEAQKRPLRHSDYDSWRHIQNQQLSPDGRYLAYAVFPQRGDGEVVLRDLKNGIEMRENAGELPPPPPPNFALPQTEESAPTPPGIALRFTSDSRTVAFLSFATHDQVEKAKREHRKAGDMPKGDLIVLTPGASGRERLRVTGVASFQLPQNGSSELAYWQPAATTASEAGTKGSANRQVVPGDLVIRDMVAGTDRKVAEVTEYTLAHDGSDVVYIMSDKEADSNGVYLLKTKPGGQPRALARGAGKYEKLTWDEAQTELAFLSGSPGDRAGKWSLFGWHRDGESATPLVSSETPGLPAGWQVAEAGTLQVSRGGSRIFFGTAPARERAKAPAEDANLPADEKVSVDLWSWKDDYIQPMQKVRAGLERSRSYRAVYDLQTKTMHQLGGPEMVEVQPGADGLYALGGDDRDYRRMQEYDERYEDSYLIDTSTGQKKLLDRKHLGRLSWSPDGHHAVYFDGKDWILFAAPGGERKNLTEKLGVPFGREEYDSPSLPPSYGPAAWTKDGRYAIIEDRFDVWRFATDGTAADLTNGFGRKNRLSLRPVRFDRPEPGSSAESRTPTFDSGQPLIFRAENEDTRDTGFYRGSLDGAGTPQKLVMAAKNFAPPIKAKNADVYVTASSTFDQYPDLLVTDGRFSSFDKVTDVGREMDAFEWGSADLIHFESAGGKRLQGLLYKPANFDPKKKYPMLVYIYERLTQNRFNFVEPRPTNVINPAFYTSNGYLVLEPDIAYKVGYPGQSALDCVLPAVQAVVDEGFVDEKAIGIQGHSWGGYQIAYMVTQTNRFRAAAPGAPVADMISAYDGIRWGPGIPRQFQYERTQSRIGGSIWEYPLRYIENSPIFMTDRIQTPLLMIHNDADDAVPWYQGIEYYLALRRLNKEVYLFSYNGEPHNLRRRANQMDYTVRLQEFFDYYLKGAAKPVWMEKGIPFVDKPVPSLPTDQDDVEY